MSSGELTKGVQWGQEGAWVGEGVRMPPLRAGGAAQHCGLLSPAVTGDQDRRVWYLLQVSAEIYLCD